MRPAHFRDRACALLIAVAALAGLASPASAAPARSSIWTIAGAGNGCSTPPACADGGPATAAQLNFPQGVAVDGAGNVYIADWGANEVRKVAPNGTISVFAGDGDACSGPPACGDGGPATNAQLTFPEGVATDSKGDVYIADTGDNEVREVLPNGNIVRLAGDGTDCSTAPACGDGAAATSAQLESPAGVAVDRNGILYIADTGDQEIRKVAGSGTISLIAGDSTVCAQPPSCGDGGAALTAQLNFPQAVALDRSGRVYIADGDDNEVRVVGRRGVINRFAGDGQPCAQPASCGDGGPATSAQLGAVNAVAADAAGNVYILDWGDSEVRLVGADGVISTIAGNGTACASPPACGDAGPPLGAQFNFPQGLALDGSGGVYVGDTYDNELRWLPGPGVGIPSTISGGGAVLAFKATARRSRVTVRFALSSAATVSLTVKGPSGHVTIAGANGAAGWNTISWNRRIAGKPARHGRYRLTVTATIGGASASSSVRIKL